MIKVNLICVGNIKEKYLKDAVNEYTKRLSKFCQINVIEVKESKQIDDVKQALKFEKEEILKRIKEGQYIFLSDLHGEEMDSVKFANKIGSLIDKGISPINFVIGGTLGLDDELRKLSSAKICLSKMTFPHQLTRVILLEQLYRSFKILNNENYHH